MGYSRFICGSCFYIDRIVPLPTASAHNILRSGFISQHPCPFIYKRKITTFAAIFSSPFLMQNQLAGLYHRPDTLGAQHLADLFPIFIYGDSLKIRLKSTRGCFFGPRTITSESRLLTTMSTFSHHSTSLHQFVSLLGDIIEQISLFISLTTKLYLAQVNLAYSRTILP